MAPPHHLLVGTFDTSAIFTLAFDPVLLTLSVVSKSAATGPHSWLNLSVRSSFLPLRLLPLTSELTRQTTRVCTQPHGRLYPV